MSRYQVLSPLKIEGGIVAEGYAEIPDAEVEELTRLGVIGKAELSADDLLATRMGNIVRAIGLLNKDDSDLWLRDGKPAAEAVAAATGFPVTAEERDAAWIIVMADTRP